MDNFIKIECCDCGVLFAVSNNLKENWVETLKKFYCPNGHIQSYIKSTADILRKQLKEMNVNYSELTKENRKLEGKIRIKKNNKNKK